jgi:TolB-like protein
MSHIDRAPVRWLLLALVSTPALAAAQQAADTRPTVAVMYFNNSALVRHAEYQPLSKGIADVLITELQGNTAIRVLEREALQRLLEEQNLSTDTTRVDKETAVRLGRILGARHMIFGGFLIDMRGHVRLDARAVNVETSTVEYVASKTAKADDLLTVIGELAVELNRGMKLPSLSDPSATTPSRAPARSAASYRALMLYSQGLAEEDRRNSKAAAELYRAALAQYPELPQAQRRLSAIANAEP